MGLCRLLFDRYRLPVSRSQALAVLRNDRRRFVIASLEGRSSPVAFGTLVDMVVECERTLEDPDPSVELRPTVYAALYQTHIPRLDRLGVVRHDRRADTVALTDAGRSLVRFMRARPVTGSVWAKLFLGLSAVYASVLVTVVVLDSTTGTLALPVVAVTGYATLAVAAVSTTVWCDDPDRRCLE